MFKSDVLELIKNGENSGVEFKRDDLTNRDLAKELVAFANFQGGCVLLGVEDGGEVSGVTRPNLEEWVMQACRDKIRPEIIPFYEVVADVEPGKDVAVVEVSRGFSVHAVWHNGGRKYYIRVGTTSREASGEELERLFQRRAGVRAELRPVSGTTVKDLDDRRVRHYFGQVREQQFPETEEDAESLLRNTEILIEDEGRTMCSVAGLLLFGKTPARFLPHAGISAAAYKGVEKDYDTIERAVLRGPLTPLTNDSGVVDNGLVEQALEFVSRSAPPKTVLEKGRRVDRAALPEEAVRETLVNAIVHRDLLLSGTDIEVSLYADRLEVISPGRLPNGITPAAMLDGVRSARNQLIKDVMLDYGYLEHMGMGVPRKIVKCMREFNGTDPELIEEEERFRVVLRRE